MYARLREDLAEQGLTVPLMGHPVITVLPVELAGTWLECWQPDGLDGDEYNLVLCLPSATPGCATLVRAHSIDVEYKSDVPPVQPGACPTCGAPDLIGELVEIEWNRAGSLRREDRGMADKMSWEIELELRAKANRLGGVVEEEIRLSAFLKKHPFLQRAINSYAYDHHHAHGREETDSAARNLVGDLKDSLVKEGLEDITDSEFLVAVQEYKEG